MCLKSVDARSNFVSGKLNNPISVTTPRKRTRQTKQTRENTVPSPIESTAKLIDDIKRLQSERASLTAQLNEVQLELTTLREDNSREITSLKEMIVQLEKGGNTSNISDLIPSQRISSYINNQV